MLTDKNLHKEDSQEMKSFNYFDLYDYSILVLILFISLVIIFYTISRAKRSPSKITLRIIKINIIFGLFLILISITWVFYIERSYDQELEILQPISIMTSEPIVLLSISILIFGMSLIIIGINQYRLVKKAKSIS